MRLAVALGLLSSGSGCRHDASAQVVIEDDVARVRCYSIASAAQLSEDSAIDMCAGAINESPGRCYVYGLNHARELSAQKLVTLCTAATSMAPIECYLRLDALGTVTEDQAIDYCKTRCNVGLAPPQTSSPECLAAAQTRTDQSLQSSGELCLGARSAGPVDCLLAGQALNMISDSKLRTLCRDQIPCQYEGGGTIAPYGAGAAAY